MNVIEMPKTGERKGWLSVHDTIISFAREKVSIEAIAKALNTNDSFVAKIVDRAVKERKLHGRPPASGYTESLLQRQISELQSEIESHRNMSHLSAVVERLIVLGMTPCEAKIAALFGKKIVTRERMYETLYWNRDEAPDPQIIAVHLTRIRGKLLSYGVEIENLWGSGIRIATDSLPKWVELTGKKL